MCYATGQMPCSGECEDAGVCLLEEGEGYADDLNAEDRPVQLEFESFWPSFLRGTDNERRTENQGEESR